MTSAEETLIKAREGDPDAFREIYLAHHASIYRYAISETGDPDEAQDITQDTFVRAWTSLNGFRGDSSLLHWLFRITRNLVIDRARARKRRPTLSLDAPRNRESDETVGDRVAAKTKTPEQTAETNEELTRFRTALAGLPEAQRSVFILREWENLPYDKIAERLGLNEGTVKSRLARAREALLDGMQELEAGRNT